MLKADCFSSWIVMRSVEQSYQNLRTFLIFRVMEWGKWPIWPCFLEV